MKPETKSDEWNSLDLEAKANLCQHGMAAFMRYKNQLKSEGHKWQDDADDILRGWIWEMIEND